jgi:hypothetical protein
MKELTNTDRLVLLGREPSTASRGGNAVSACSSATGVNLTSTLGNGQSVPDADIEQVSAARVSGV